MYCLYCNYFNKIETHKGSEALPKPNIIEEEFEVEFNLSAQTLYLELITRTRFDKLKDSKNEDEFLNIVEESWENY